MIKPPFSKSSATIKVILAIFALTVSTPGTAQNIFQKIFGTSAYEEIWGLDLTADNGFILGGYTSFGNAYIIKINSNGDTLWTKNIDAGGLDLLYSIQQTNDSGYVSAGRTNGFGAGGLDIFLIKTDFNGNNQWSKSIGGTGDESANSVKQTLDGGYIIAGNTYSFSAILNDFYIVKTNSIGNIVWSKSIGGTGNDNAFSIIQTQDSSYVAVGLTTSVGAGDKDILLIKLDKNGNILFMKTYGGTGDDRANSIQQTIDGGLIISGVTNSFGAGNYDFNLIKTDSLGNLSWEKTFGGSGDEWAYSVKQTTDNGYILAGYTTSFGLGSSDYYLVKTNSAGDTLWTKTFGGTMAEYGTEAIQTLDNSYAIIGYSQNFGTGSYDFYFVKTDSNGNGICNQNNTTTLVNSPTPIVTIPSLTVSSGGISSSGSPTITSGTIINTLCTNVGVQSNSQTIQNYSFYPNPIVYCGILTFDNPKKENNTLTIYDMQGRMVRTIKNLTSNIVEIEKQDLITGLYFFQLCTEKKIVATGKLIIE